VPGSRDSDSNRMDMAGVEALLNLITVFHREQDEEIS